MREWSFKRAVAIQTFDGYDPIPVPLNIIYRIFITPLGLYKKKDEMKTVRDVDEKRAFSFDSCWHIAVTVGFFYLQLNFYATGLFISYVTFSYRV